MKNTEQMVPELLPEDTALLPDVIPEDIIPEDIIPEETLSLPDIIPEENDAEPAETRTMKDRPVWERPYEACLEYGPERLSDAQLLALILRSGVPGTSVLDLAGSLLRELGSRDGLGFLMRVSRAELQSFPGIGQVKASELLAVGEISRRIASLSRKPKVNLGDPDTIASFFMEEMCYLDHEEMCVAMFDSRNHLLHHMKVSMGTVNASFSSPREIFRTALRHGAVYLVVLHNHPSGDPRPSSLDLANTRKLIEAGRLLEVPLMDHIIIGDHCFLSLRKEGVMRFGAHA